MNISEYIPYGQENAISRAELVTVTGLSDRQVRNEIERARNNGEMIMSSSQVRGYWKSDDTSEMEDFIRQTNSRIKALHFAKKTSARGAL